MLSDLASTTASAVGMLAPVWIMVGGILIAFLIAELVIEMIATARAKKSGNW